MFTDYKVLLDGLRRGERWTTRARHPCADMWREIWHLLKEHGDGPLGGWDIRKVKAHVRTSDQIGLAHESLVPIWANELADAKAKTAARSNVWMLAVAKAVSDRSIQVTTALNHIHDMVWWTGGQR